MLNFKEVRSLKSGDLRCFSDTLVIWAESVGWDNFLFVFLILKPNGVKVKTYGLALQYCVCSGIQKTILFDALEVEKLFLLSKNTKPEFIFGTLLPVASILMTPATRLKIT
uniref:Uncharacterized protein n=1 Tax=Romanomermis culicivorax TaxID=13658 RepID=A0A915JXF2_ROMCU